MVQSNVLYVWFSFLGLCYIGYYLLGNHHFTLLFPSMCRGLSLVVAFFLDFRFYSRLFVHLLLSLFRYEIIDKRCSLNIFILWLHLNNGIFILFVDWLYWFLCLLLVYTQNIQCCQSGLEICKFGKV